VTLGIANIHSGTDVSNVIPETAKFRVSLRFFNMGEGAKAVDIVKEIPEATARMHHCTVEFSDLMKILSEPVINDSHYSELAAAALNDILPEGTVSSCPKRYASESYSMYLERYPGVFAFLGIRNEELGTGAEHHNEKFDVDDSVQKLGVLSTAKYAVSLLAE